MSSARSHVLKLFRVEKLQRLTTSYSPNARPDAVLERRQEILVAIVCESIFLVDLNFNERREREAVKKNSTNKIRLCSS